MKRTTRWLAMLLALLMLSLAFAGCAGEETLEEDGADAPQEEEPETPHSDTLTYSDGEVTLHFTMGEDGHWVWRDDVEFPLDEHYVTDLMSAVGEMTKATPFQKPEKLNKYGLDSKKKYLTATDKDGGSLTFYFGDKNKDGRRYMRRADEKGKVYLAPKMITSALSRSIYDMMILPELPQLETERIHTVSIRGPEVKMELHQSEGIWTREDKDVTEKLTGFVEFLENMKLERCLDYRPSKGVDELCGFRDRRAVMEVDYTNTVGVESSFTLEVAYKRGESRYVRVSEDSTIYLMSIDQLQPLLTLAEKGLSTK